MTKNHYWIIILFQILKSSFSINFDWVNSANQNPKNMDFTKKEHLFQKKIEEFYGRKIKFQNDSGFSFLKLYLEVTIEGGFQNFNWNQRQKEKLLYRNLLLDYERQTFSKVTPFFLEK